ncbi:KIF-binding protein-like isoform X1 [Odontomachus brunneus]|uniref:KIF-binding protein-like isoform X1 n=1 Tax=Odontomachus brunneus TaxID=486640 RepID=UPI0013F25EA5|nr:KIF-binding protein-like isoform X1 [Odontomachus brunneus]
MNLLFTTCDVSLVSYEESFLSTRSSLNVRVKMSTENAGAQECEFVDSASVTKVEFTENVKPTTSGTMEINKEYCALLKLVFNLVTNIANEKEKDKPYAEHIETLREIEMRLNKFHRTFNSQDAPFHDSIALAQIYLKLSEIYYSDDSRNDKLYIAREHLMQCVQLLKGKELDRKVIFTVIKAFFELGCISMKLKDLEESEQFTRKALELYLTYTEKKEDYPAPTHFPIVTGIEIECNYIYEMDILYTRILKTLLSFQHYNVNKYSPIDNCTMIIYAHKILEKMLKTAPLSVSYSELAIFSSHLSSEFLKYKRFNEARHHLAVASFSVKKYYEVELIKIDGDKSPRVKARAHDTHALTAANVAIKWAQYGNTLLRSSSERVLYNEEEDESATEFAMLPKLLFTGLQDELQNFTDLIRDAYIADYKDAKVVFRRVLKWLEEAKGFAIKVRTMSTNINMNISRGIFHAYKYLICYEREKNEQMKLYKQLMDTLNDFSKSLSADADPTVRKYTCLQVVLASYSLLEIKTQDLESHDKMDSELLGEIDKLVKYNVHNSELYLYGNK